ncbi:M23 family metallopeptidase [Enterobacter cloacae]|uniref:Pyocin R, lytic enzyme n=1 Tax=Enterobacter cloacae TaxID=550 RepID=A0A157IJD7_ENTCL|nr:M23 family metallopeptidase [Enterobacter cloacae]CZU84086.1 pyocin R%2C lytic enzyme [Enterobacter cloacae]SAH59429.1 pyocin R%2C lytic enzyme [Enterobacter cloacae]
MIISPPFLRDKDVTQSDADWIEAMMPVNARRGYPLNASESWHGGILISHTDTGTVPEKVRAIADGTVVSFRKPSPPEKRDQFPLKYAPVRGTDDGYVLLKHETEIGSGEDGRVVFYSLYMHLKFLETEIKADAKIYRKDPLGSSGMTDGQNEFHFQIFCDDANISKLTGRKTKELDISKDGRTDAVYGDIHFYIPTGTKFYDKAPVNNSTSLTGLSELYTSSAPLYVSMTLAQGNCTMVTRQKNTQTDGKYDLLGEPLVNADGEDYEYNLYKTAMRNYKESPSAGYELLRFGRVINTEHETLVPADAPLWMTVNYPGGVGVVNLADPSIKKFSDADFPHWTGWLLVDDDNDTHSQCNSALIRKLQEEGSYETQSNRLICCLPFEWEKSTIGARYKWLMSGLPWEQCTSEKTAIWQVPGTEESKERTLMSEEDYGRFKQHAEALCFDAGAFSSGRLWHFHPVEFISLFRKCNWLSEQDFIRTIRKTVKNESSLREEGRLTEKTVIEHLNQEKEKSTGVIIRPSEMRKSLALTMRSFGISSTIRIAHFLSQIYCETGRVSECEEKGKDSYFDKYEPEFDSKHYNKNELARKLGNDQVGDGIRFKGRGIIQLTGRTNYRMYGEYKGSSEKFISSAGAETLISSSYYCCDAGGFYWVQKQRMKMQNKKLVKWGPLSIHYWADQGTTYAEVKAVTKCVNGGSNGLDGIRWPCFEHAFYALNDSVSPNDNVKFLG